MSVRKLRWPLRLLLIAVTVQVVVRVGGPDVRGMSVVGLLEVAANLLIVVVVGYFLFAYWRGCNGFCYGASDES